MFHDTLQQQTEQARAHLLRAPVLAAIPEGRFNLESYRYFLSQAYHHVKHTVPLMMACGARLPARLEWMREALVEYIRDEYGHQEWILNDLEALGADVDAVRHGQPDLPIEMMVAWLYDAIARGNPVSFFGMVHVLEGTSIALATPLAEQVQNTLHLPKKAFSYLYSHGALDQDHYQFFTGLINRIEDHDDRQAVIHASKVIYRLYGDMLHAVPVAAAGEQRGGAHERVA
ncbi:TenA family transcriptional regulator [Alloalcanivorax gelatiniphagus]|uniref:Iron-containing redox enzyme family protein n=1 Tax=Alloalcanivorax gelatiniphagus TaxID=1194167 RepID=A0ABY2XLV1_9GAMM|nr:iron-containing redox enzyme family protein [Alloalcanivorax gelatiniphagus]TMW12238.1 iron-containing redox enzyme family protein [Alloalcanivorax gelatiniphagus]